MPKESKQTKNKTFAFVVVIEGDVLNCSTKSRFIILLNFSCDEELFFSFMFFWFN